MKLKLPILALLAASVLAPGIRAEAATNLVSNPDFSLGFTDWSMSLGPSSLIAISSYYQQTSTNDYPQMWTDNGFSDSPNGGNFVIADGFEVHQVPFSQAISGLEIGATYDLSFEYAGAQELNFSGDTVQHWNVLFGSESYDTPTMNVPNHGFLGWYNGSNTFTATSTTQTLRFLAVGTPGVPPWLLLDNVQLTKNEVPGPLPFVGLGCAAAWSRKLRRRIQNSGSSLKA